MIIKSVEKVEAMAPKDAGVKDVKFKIMLGEPEGVPNFILRHFRIEPGGHSPRHTHNWEHEVYVLSGSGTAVGAGKKQPISTGDAIFVPPNEEHQFIASDKEPLVFLCIIPKV